MSKGGFKVMDSDMHVIEPPDLWQRYLEPAWRGRAPVGTTQGGRDIGLVFADGRPANQPDVDMGRWSQALAAHMGPREPDYRFAVESGWDGGSQLEAMDREGIDVAVLFPSRGLFALGLDSTQSGAARGLEPEFAAAIARAYNTWLAELCSADRRRMYGAAMVAPHDVASAVKETRRSVSELGFRSIFLLPGWVNRRPWHHPSYDPLWAVCQELDVPVVFHGGGPDLLTGDYGQGFRESLMMWHTFAHSLGPMSALVSLIGGGVFDRFPKLRAGFLEANCSWAPWLIYRLEDHYEDYVGRHEIKLERSVTEYFVQNCFVSVEADEGPSDLYVQRFGDDNVAFSTDYPHPDAKFPHAVERFLSLPLADSTKRKFLWDNCVRLYGLEH
jgi:predicted TIM-barrel fold metal-dependent hydrolase